jgi:hypothetical protein
MGRIGKIARLPEQIREQLNRRLQDGENGQHILAWLNSSQEVKAVLAREFEDAEINDVNLTAWRQGGFREWVAQQAALSESRRVMAEGTELSATGQNALADKLSVWLLGRYVVATRRLLENEDDPAAWKLLRELCHDVVTLRRGDHGAEWLRIEQEKLDLHRRRQEREEKAAEADSEAEGKKPAAPVLSEEEKERRWRQIFGMQPL